MKMLARTCDIRSGTECTLPKGKSSKKSENTSLDIFDIANLGHLTAYYVEQLCQILTKSNL